MSWRDKAAKPSWRDKAIDEGLTLQDVKKGAIKGLEYLGRGLNIPGGLVRTALAGAAGEAGTEDLTKALEGRTPSSEELLEKAGIGEGPPISAPLMRAKNPLLQAVGMALSRMPKFDPSTRKVAGFAADVATDPLSYVSFGGGKIANPISAATEVAGKSLYGSALKSVDTRLAEKGLEKVSPYLLEQGAVGSLSSLKNAMTKRANQLKNIREGLYSQAPAAEILPYAASQPAFENIAKIAENPYKSEKANQLLDFLSLGERGGPMSLQKASDIKSQLYDSLPQNAFDQFGRLTSDGQKMLRDLSLGYKTEIEKAASAAKPGLGEQISNVNKEWGALIGAEKPTQKEIAKEARKNLITETKLGALTIKPAITAAMYAGKALNNPLPKSIGGVALKEVGGLPLDPFYRQLLLQQTPWLNMGVQK